MQWQQKGRIYILNKNTTTMPVNMPDQALHQALLEQIAVSDGHRALVVCLAGDSNNRHEMNFLQDKCRH